MRKDCDIRAVVGTDRLGRKLPLPEQAGGLREDRLVGMFYFVWHDQSGTDGPYDVEKIIEKDPSAATDMNHPLWGPIGGAPHHWGEPLFGYYLSKDEWVIRKHLEMLSYADVDFIVFDATNRAIYFEQTTLVMHLISEYNKLGYKVPKVAFYTNTESGATVDEIYNQIYKENLYPESWFYLDGKPFIIDIPNECSAGAQAFFTHRTSQWPFSKQKQNGFPWMEFIRPQRVYRDAEGNPEVINVSLAQHPNCAHSDGAFYGDVNTWGRSYHDGHMDVRINASDWGFNAQEQWEYAISKDPRIIFVTGWNEWIAGRWYWPQRKNADTTTLENDEGKFTYIREAIPDDRHTMCDCCSKEYSRDIEPMKGGYFDNYFYQLISNVRRFKGMPEIPSDRQTRPRDINEPWTDGITYSDYRFGNVHRNHRGYGKHVYVNKTGQNDILEMRVMSDYYNLYFSVTCTSDIIRQSNWLQLYLNTTGRTNDGFCGYSYLANLKPLETDTGLAVWKNRGFRVVQRIPMRIEGKQMKLIIPKEYLGLNPGDSVRLEFKWADGHARDNTVEDFYLNGDAAPYGRLNYLYICEV